MRKEIGRVYQEMVSSGYTLKELDIIWNDQRPDRYQLDEKDIELLKAHSLLKFQIEEVPLSCFYSNVRSCISKKQWDTVRKEVYLKAGYVCELCSEKGDRHPVECHEVWKYDDIYLVQKLDLFQALCPACHQMKHPIVASKYGNGQRVAEARFVKLNQIDPKYGYSILRSIYKLWGIRSAQKWSFDLNLLSNYGIKLNQILDRSGLERTLLTKR